MRWIFFSILLTPFLYSEETGDQECTYCDEQGDFECRLSRLEQERPVRPSVFEPASVKCRGVAHSEGDFLYWKFSSLGMPYAYKGILNGTQTVTTQDKILNASLHYDPGFRISLGYTIPYDEWDLSAIWTQLRSEKTEFSESGSDLFNSVFIDTIFPIWNVKANANFAFFQPTQIQAKMEIDLNSVDVELGKFLFFFKSLALQPSIGFKGCWIAQKEKIQFDGVFVSFPDETTFTSDAEISEDFQAAGLRLGLDLRMILHRGWELYARGFSSLLYGRTTLSFHEVYIRPILPPFNPADIDENLNKNDFHLFTTQFEYSLGVKWGSYFFKRKTYLSLKLGYEQQVWVNFNQMYSIPFPVGNSGSPTPVYQPFQGNLGVHGLVAGAKFHF